MMKKVLLTALLALSLTSCGGGNDSPAPQTTTPPPSTQPVATLPEQIEQYLATGVDAQAPGISVLVKKEGVIVYAGSKGLARTMDNEAITSETGFRLASLSKPFTGLAIMLLLERGQLTLEDDITLWLPELNTTYEGITIFQLLTHSSGVKDFVNDIDNIQRLHNWRNDDVISQYLNQENLEFTPGSQGQYSNTGYVLLAMIVERASGIHFAEFMATEVFHPAQMSNTYVIDGQFPKNESDALNYASTANIFGFTSLTNGSSSQVSSVSDLEQFIAHFRNDGLLQPATRQLMLQCHRFINNVGAYGLGWQVQCDSNDVTQVFSHSGSWDGFQSILFVDLGRDLEIIILSNGGSVTAQHQFQIFDLITDFY